MPYGVLIAGFNWQGLIILIGVRPQLMQLMCQLMCFASGYEVKGLAKFNFTLFNWQLN